MACAIAIGGHPYGLPTNGDVESLAAVQRGELKGLARELITRGALQDRRRRRDRRDARRRAARRRLRRSAGERRAQTGSASAIRRPRRVEVIDLDVPQSTIRFGRPAVRAKTPTTSPRRADARAGRRHWPFLAPLPRGPREARPRLFGLPPRSRPTIGELPLSAERRPRTSAPTNRSTSSSADPISRTSGLTDEELEKGKKYLIGSYPLRFDTSAKIAGQLVHIQLEGHGADWLVERNQRIAAVTMADARAPPNALFGDGALSVVLVGRPAKA